MGITFLLFKTMVRITITHLYMRNESPPTVYLKKDSTPIVGNDAQVGILLMYLLEE